MWPLRRRVLRGRDAFGTMNDLKAVQAIADARVCWQDYGAETDGEIAVKNTGWTDEAENQSRMNG